MRILITGAAGFLGSRLAAWILENIPDAIVEGIDDLSCGYAENVPAGVLMHTVEDHRRRPPLIPHGAETFAEFKARVAPPLAAVSLGDGRLAESSAWQDYDIVFHLAAYAAEGLSPFIRQYNYANNLLATAEIVNLCLNRDVGRLVFTSSMAAYGPGHAPFSERDLTNPIDPYGIAKRAAELDIAAAANQHGLDACIIRPHNLYGPGQSIWQRYRNVLGLWMRARLEDRPLLIYGDGNQRRAFSFIDDCLPCLWEAAVSPAASRQVINLGGSTPVSIREAAELLLDVTGGGSLRYVEPRHEVKDAWCTTYRSEDLLGYLDRTSLGDGLSQMWDWAQRVWPLYPERRHAPEPFALEVSRGLYPYWQEILSPKAE